MPKPANVNQPDVNRPDIIQPIEQRLISKRAELINAQEQLRMQLNGVANQIFLIDQILNPQDATNAKETETSPGPPLEDGKI